MNILQHVFCPREGNLNLTTRRELSVLCNPHKSERERHFLLTRVPFRGFYKHQVEVEKRIQWKRPVKVPCILPEKSGDLSALPEQDLDKPPSLFEKSSEYQT